MARKTVKQVDAEQDKTEADLGQLQNAVRHIVDMIVYLDNNHSWTAEDYLSSLEANHPLRKLVD